MSTLIAGAAGPLSSDITDIVRGMRRDAAFTTADTYADAMEALGAGGVELVIADLAMPGLTSLADIIQLLIRAGDARIVVLADGMPEEMQERLRLCGVAGLAARSAEPIWRTVAMVLRGGIAFPSTLAIPSASMGPAAVRRPLSARQLRVLADIVAGKSNRRIASDLALSPNTVKAHVSEVLRRLGVDNRAAAMAVARDGWG
ncbi:MAG: DNA-binding response regulator [Solirubrobacterales bacterium]